MKRSILGTVLGPWIALVGLGLGIYNYFDRGMPWRGEALWSAEWIGAPILIWGPLVAAASAVDGGNLRRTDRQDLMRSIDVRRRLPGLTVAATGLPALFVLVVLAIPYGVAVVWTGDQDYWQFGFQLATQAFILTALSAVGLAIGVLAGNRAGPAVALGLGVAILWGSSSGRFSPFDVGASSGSLLGVAVPSKYLALQILLLIACTASMIVIAVWRFEERSRIRIGIALVLLTAGYLTVPAIGPDRYESQRATEMPQDCLTASSPRICVYAQHGRFLDPLVRQVLPVYAAAQQAGVAHFLPKEVIESLPGETTTTVGSARWLPDPQVFASGQIRQQDVIRQVVLPRWCPALYGTTPPSRDFWSNVSTAERALSTIVANQQETPAKTRAAASQLRIVWPRLAACEGAH